MLLLEPLLGPKIHNFVLYILLPLIDFEKEKVFLVWLIINLR